MPAADCRGFRLSGPVAVFMLLLAGCGGGGGGSSDGGPPPVTDLTPPEVLSMKPADGTVGFDPGEPIQVVFSEPLDPATIGPSTFRLTSNGVPVTGNLAHGAAYLLEVTQGVKDLAGNPLAAVSSIAFETGAPPSAPVWGVAFLDNNYSVLYDAATRTATLSWAALSPLDNLLVSAALIQDDPATGLRVASPWDNATVPDGSGEFVFGGAFPAGIYSFTAERLNDAGPARRILCVTTLYVGGAAEIPIAMQDVTPTSSDSRLEKYCRNCHPSSGEPVRRGQVLRCLHDSGMIPGAYRPEEGSPVTLDDFGRVTCESCHTAHRPTANPFFLVMPPPDYDQSWLCKECH